MKIDVSNVVVEIVENTLPRFTADKLLLVSIRASYLHFPHGYKNGNDLSDEFNYTTFLHFIFHRPNNYTKVMFLESSAPFIKEGDEFKLVSDHDSCWKADGVFSSVSKVHNRVISELEIYCENLGEDFSNILRFQQPNFSSFEKIKLHKGKTEGVNYENRNCKLSKENDQFILSVIK